MAVFTLGVQSKHLNIWFSHFIQTTFHYVAPQFFIFTAHRPNFYSAMDSAMTLTPVDPIFAIVVF